jgi:ATP-dependent Clp protease ATP-binding subunit ClpC
MSEYMEKFATSSLIGAPPGYVGYDQAGQLTERVRRKPYSVVLFDEIEKAHPDVLNLLLQILDDGRLTDNNGHVVDFKNTVVILTSNLGTSEAAKNLGFDAVSGDEDYERMREKLLRLFKNTFRLEFVNRLNEIIVFHRLSRTILAGIINLLLDQVVRRLKDKQISVELDQTALDYVIDKGYDPSFGARPLKRVIKRLVEEPLADRILRGVLKAGQKAHFSRPQDMDKSEDALFLVVDGEATVESSGPEAGVSPPDPAPAKA